MSRSSSSRLCPLARGSVFHATLYHHCRTPPPSFQSPSITPPPRRRGDLWRGAALALPVRRSLQSPQAKTVVSWPLNKALSRRSASYLSQPNPCSVSSAGASAGASARPTSGTEQVQLQMQQGAGAMAGRRCSSTFVESRAKATSTFSYIRAEMLLWGKVGFSMTNHLFTM